MSSSNDKKSEHFRVKAFKFIYYSTSVSALAKVIFKRSTPGVDLEISNRGQTVDGRKHRNKKNACLQLLTKAICVYSIDGIKDLGVTL